MMAKLVKILALAWTLCGAPNTALAEVCQGFGPQAPRDIDNPVGENKSVFSIAPSLQKMNLCNIHFHKQAEHKAKDFSIFAGDMDHGGYRCQATYSLTRAELRPLQVNYCSNIGPGDTVEFHWVYTSCDVEPGEGLESCFSDACTNPNLRVEAQVFLVVNGPRLWTSWTSPMKGTSSTGTTRRRGCRPKRELRENSWAPPRVPASRNRSARPCRSPGVFARSARRWVSRA